MRRIRNSVKALIISLCVAVVAVGVILGVVLTNRGKKPHDPLNPPKISTLTPEQVKLGEAINASIQKPDYLTEVDTSKIVDENGDPIAIEKVSAFYEYGFEVMNDGDSNNLSLYLYSDNLDDAGVYKTRNIAKEVGATASIGYVTTKYDNTMSISYSFMEDDCFKVIIAMFNSEYEVENLKTLTFNFDGNNIYFYYKSEKINLLDFVQVHNYLYIIGVDQSNETLYTISYNLEENEKYHIYNSVYSGNIQISVSEDAIYFPNENYIHVEYFVNNELRIKDIEKIHNHEYSYKIFNTGLIIHDKEIVDKSDIDEYTIYNSNEYYKSTYNYFCFETNELKSINLEEGYVFATIKDIDGSNFYLIEQKINSNNKLIDSDYLLVYFDNNGNKIFKYNSNSIENSILYSNKSNVLTNDGILAPYSDGSLRYVFKFNTDDYNYTLGYNLVNNNIVNNDTIFIHNESNNLYYIVKMNGQFFTNEGYNSICSYQDGYYLCKKTITTGEEDDSVEIEEYSIVNVTSGKEDVISEYADETFNKDLSLLGFGLYYTNSSNNFYKLFDYKGDLLLDDVTSIDVVSVNNYTLVSIRYLDNNVSLEKKFYTTRNYEVIGNIEELSDGTISNFGYNTIEKTGGKAEISKQTFTGTSYEYYYPSGTWKLQFEGARVRDLYLKITFSLNSSYQLTTSYDYGKNTSYDHNASSCSGVTLSYDKNSHVYTVQATGLRSWGGINGAGAAYDAGAFQDDETQTVSFSKCYFYLSAYKANTNRSLSYSDTQSKSIGRNKFYNSTYISSTIYCDTNTSSLKYNAPADIIGGKPYGITALNKYADFSDNISQTSKTFELGQIFNNIEILDYIYHGDKSNPSINQTFYAYVVYEPLVYKVDLNADNPTSSNHTTTIYIKYSKGMFSDSACNNELSSITIPSKSGYTFGGYYSSGNEQIIDSSGNLKSSTILTSDNTIIAKWQTNNYKIRFYFNTGGRSRNYTGVLYDGVENFTNGQLISTATSYFVNKGSSSITNSITSNQDILYYYDAPTNIVYSNDYNTNLITIAKNKFNDTVTILNSNSKFFGWVCFYKNIVSEENLKTFNSIYRLEDYVKDNNLGNNGTINIYAAYELRDYYVSITNNYLGGSVDLSDDSGIVNNSSINTSFGSSGYYSSLVSTNIKNTTANVISEGNKLYNFLNGKYSFIDKSVGTNTTTNTYNVGLGNNFQIRYYLGNFTQNSNTYNLNNYYDFNSVTIYNMPYYNGGSTFSYANVTFNKNGGVSSSGGTVNKDGNNYYIGQKYGGTQYNTFSVTFDTNRFVTIAVNNCYLPGSISGSTYTVNSGTVTSTSGEYGFNIYVEAISKQTTNDTVSKSGGSANGNFIYYSAQPVVSKGTSSTGFGYYIWLNGKKVSLNSSNDYFYTNIADGYYVRVYNGIAYCFAKNSSGGYADRQATVNANNTQILAMRPSQTLLRQSSNATNLVTPSSSLIYELSTYLNEIVVGGTKLTLKLARNINSNSYTRNEFEFKVNDITMSRYYGNNIIIPYQNSDYYKVLYIYSFIDSSSSRSYKLYVAQKSDISGNLSAGDNSFMYFLVSDSNINSSNGTRGTSCSITMNFANLSKDITINVNNGGDTFTSGDVGVNVKYSKNSSFNSKVSNGNAFSLSGSNSVRTGTLSVVPSDATLLSITPQDGYLIKSIVVKMNNTTLYNFEYSSLDLNYNNSSYFTYLGFSGSGASSTASSLIKYNFRTNNNFMAYSYANGASYRYGIYWADYQSKNWRDISSANSFESLYLLISGIYHNVSIDIVTQSYVEFDFFGTSSALGYQSGNLTNLTIANKNGGIIYGRGNYSNALVILGNSNSGSIVLYRVIFLGKASLFKNGVIIYASNNKNSVEFLSDSVKYYNDSSGNAINILKNSDSGNEIYQSYNTSKINNDNVYNLTYLKIDSVTSFFGNSTTTDVGNRGYNDYIKARKYLLSLTCVSLPLNLTTNSYIFNRNPSNYVPKENGGLTYKYQLDDTHKTNSWFNETILTNIDINPASISKTNWQSRLNTKIENISGFGIYYVYKEIPGYYLQYVDVIIGGKTVSLLVADNYKMGTHLVNGIYVNIAYNSSEGEFYIYLYDNNGAVSNDANSLNLLKYKDIRIDFYSMAYSININYRNSGSASYISSYSSFNKTQEVAGYYDSMFTLSSSPYTNMKGYTFVGWGSEEYYDGTGMVSRYNYYEGGINSWNSSSRWFDARSLFSSGNINSLRALKNAGDNFSSDFYVAGGRFISDTGSFGTQNYNFWTAHADTFLSNIGRYNTTGNKFKIDLYAIWKPNTYVVQLNFNDNNSGSSNWYTSSNGSTMARLGTYKNISPSSVNSSNYNFLTGITNNGYNITYSDGTTTTYYAYVTFDTNNWYIVKDPALAISYLNAKESNYNHKGLLEANNLLNMVIDRYGYTWLGWFDSKMSGNVSSTATNFNNSRLIYGSVYTNDTLNSGVSALPKLNISRYNNFSANGYFNDTIDTKFFYYNRNNTSDGINLSNVGALKSGIYFYIYNVTSKTGNRGYYSTNDYLNIYYANTTASYFDTSISYNAYGSSKGDQITFNGSRNYRYITLFANWQVNSYRIIVDFADFDSDSYSRFGSSLVTNYNSDGSSRFTSSLSFDFDSVALETFLNKFNPTRVGYDFLGWSFRYTTPRSGDIQNGNIANTYVLSNALINNYSTAVAGSFNSILFLSEGIQNSNASYETYTNSVISNKEFVNIFAVWRAQEYSINISININEGELGKLLGGNDVDSSFILGLYDKDNNSNYYGINASNLTYGKTDGSYNEILANVYFKIYFDKLLETAEFEVTIGDNSQNTLKFNLKQLFAVSTGYEFLGWIYDSDDPNALIVKNLLDSQFNRGGSNIINKTGELAFTGETFDYELYTKLFYSSYLFNGNTYTRKLTDIENAINSSKNSNIYEAEEIVGNRVLSTSFGYISDNASSSKFYIYYNYMTNKLFYKDNNGIVRNIILYVDEGGSLFTDLTFDYSNLYYKGKIIRFVNNGDGTYDAYYVENNQVKRISISVRAEGVGDIVNGRLFAFTTREFTLYSSWKIKQKEITITNGNNTGTDATNNPGLSGYYEISSTNQNNITESNKTSSENDAYLKLVYDYYNNLNVNILPYFNGRFLSEMTLSFYSIEQYGSTSGTFVNYSTVKYTLTFKFSWNNSNLYVNLESLIMASEGRDPVSISGNLINNWVEVIGSNWNKLTLIDRDTTGTGLVNVRNYGEYRPAKRLDINRFVLDLQKVSSSIEINCKFSLQTFDVNLYNVIDEYGNSLSQRENSPQGVFKTRFEKSVPFDNSEFGSGGPFLSSEQFSRLNMATVSVDCASSESAYNVPYGYFIYGMFYTSSIYPNRPTDAIENVNQEFGGYDYIYAYGYYNYGNTTTKLEANGDDMFYSQSSGVLGDNSTFAQSVRLNMSFYTFSGWYTSSIDTDGTTVLFTTYGDAEGRYINHNIRLYAYYYAENKPTDVIFYVWDDNTMTYIPYNGNSTDYKSNFKSENSAFKTEFVNGVNIVTLKDVVTTNIVDSDGYAVFQYYLQYGVNATKFNNFDNYYSSEISSDPGNLTLLNYITRTYWYYQESYYVYYFNYNSKKYYIYYDVDYDASNSDCYNGFYYLNDANEKVYIELYSNDMVNFSIYINGAQIGLSYETKYIYDYVGSKLYVKMLSNSMEMYYEVHELTEDALIKKYGSLENVPEFVASHDPRFYVEIEGNWYYLLQRKDVTSNSSMVIYRENGSELIGASITTLDMYYIIYNDVYYEIEMGSNIDIGGSIYYNPYQFSNKVTLNMYDTNIDYYFNYSNKLLYSNASLSGAGVEFSYVSYCPVNDNYAIGYQLNTANGKWEIQGITLNKLLTPNISFWYGGEYYGFVGYIQVNDSDIATLKLNEDAFEGDSAIVVDSDCELIYSVFKEKINYEFSDAMGYSAEYRTNLLNEVGKRVNEYTLDSMLSALVTVDSYIPNEVTKNLDAVIVRIVVRFDNMEFDDGNGNKTQISLSAVVKYKFKMISISSTVLTDNIYAIPIYSQNIVRFTDESVTATAGSISFDTDKMELNHFEEFTGTSTHIYNPSFGDYLQFAVLTKEQYSMLIANSGDLADYLNSMILNNNIVELINTYDGTNVKTNIKFTPDSAGEYYIVSFYYKTGTNYVTRVSDNVVHYDNQSGASYELVNIVSKGIAS